MKKIICFLFFIFVMLTPGFVFSADRVILGEWNFENSRGSFDDFMTSDGRITTSTTNWGTRFYGIDYINNSHRFNIVGYKENEIEGNASRTFVFKFEPYSLEKYPDTKLVVMFDQQITGKEKTPNYQLHRIFGSEGAPLSMYFLEGKNGNFCNPRPNNNGAGAIVTEKDYQDKIIYVLDFETKTLSYTSKQTTKRNLPFANGCNATTVNKLSFMVTKGESLNIDNIEIFAMPDTLEVVTEGLEKFYFSEGETEIEFNSPLKSAKASIFKNGSKVKDCTVTVNGRFANVSYNGLSYGEEYTLKITEAVSVVQTELLSEKVFNITMPSSPAAVTGTNAENGYNPFEDLYFNFDRKISSADVKLTADGIDFKDFATDLTNGVEIKFNTPKRIPFGSEVNVCITATDILGVKAVYEYSFKSADAHDVFDVYQQSYNVAQAGMGGFSIAASFDGDAPGWVYFERDTINPRVESDLPFEPAAFVKIVDPDGNTRFVYDLTDCQNGLTAVAFQIPQGQSGLWQFQFADSRNTDTIGIGVENASVWGVRGECILGLTPNTLREGYIYVPQKVDSLIAGATKKLDFTITDENSNVYNVTDANHAFAKKAIEINDIEGEAVYKVTFPEYFHGGFLVDRAPSLICPTKEMAISLKGGWIETEGILCQGTIQQSARLEALRLLETKNLNVTITKLALPSVINYPMAEAQLFSPYGLITPLGHQLQRQILDPASPYLGSVFDEGSIPSTSWETGHFYPGGNDAVFGNVAALDAQLNYFYQNEALANRAALMILGSIIQMSEDSIIREGNNALHYPTTHGNFYFHWISEGYEGIRDLLDAETVRVIDNGLEAMADKQGTFRGMNTTNQWFFTVAAVDSVARTAGEERHHDLFKNHINALYTNDIYKSRLGQATSGYFVEGYGCDGQYHNLCQLLLYVTYRNYREWENADKATIAQLDNIIGDNVEFNSLFWLPQPKAEKYASANCFTSRTNTGYAITTHTNYEIVTDLFPLAKRRLETSNMPSSGLGSAGTFSCLITNNEWAMRVINKYYPLYENHTKNYNSHGSIALYNAFKNQYTAESTLLPCEQTEGIWDKNGIIAVKHKGIYLNVFYTLEDETELPSMSFMGGGATNIWSKGTGTVVASKKPVDYENGVTTSNQIKSSCIYGTDSNGKFFFSGKEMASLKWIEKDKIFEISGTLPDKNITVTWRYELTDTSLRVTASASGDVSEDLWVNIPLVLHEADAIFEHEEGKITQYYYNNSVCFTTENETALYENSSTKNFRVKLENGTATIDITEKNAPKVIVEDISVSDSKVSVYFKSQTGKAEPVTVIIASYGNDGTIIDTEIADYDAYFTENSLAVGDIDIQGASYIKAFIWESLATMNPYYCEKYEL